MYNVHVSVPIRVQHLEMCHASFPNNIPALGHLPDLLSFTIGSTCNYDILQQVTHVKTLTMHFPGFSCNQSPVFPHVTMVTAHCSRNSSLHHIHEKFPVLRKLILVEWTPETEKLCLQPLAGLQQLRALRIVSSTLVDLGPLAGITQLEKLDVSKCRNIIDFSAVQHVPIVQKWVPN
jgi:hypothetical protein